MDAGPAAGPTWYLYLIECHNGRLYTGISTDPERRFAAHAAGRGAMFTRINRPLRLLGCRPYPNQSLVTKAETDLKRLDRTGKLAWARENPLGGMAGEVGLVDRARDRPLPVVP
jgi:putative endonuclease